MNEQTAQVQPEAREQRVTELEIERRHLVFLNDRDSKNAAHHHEQLTALRATVRARLEKIDLLDREINVVHHPVAAPLTDRLDADMHRALQGGAR